MTPLPAFTSADEIYMDATALGCFPEPSDFLGLPVWKCRCLDREHADGRQHRIISGESLTRYRVTQEAAS